MGFVCTTASGLQAASAGPSTRALTAAYSLLDARPLFRDSDPTAITCMKLLPDGAAVCVNRKTIVGISNGCLFIEEADRSAGIKVVPDSHFPPVTLVPGNLISFGGTMGSMDGERVIHATSDFECDFDATARISPLGMSSAALLGWPVYYKEPDGPRIRGLLPTGLLVRVWGQVMAREVTDEEGLWYVYLDDGWHKKDGSYPGYRGLRVYSDRIPVAGEDYDVAVGVCTTKAYDPTPLGPAGDEFVIPVIHTTDDGDLHPPTEPGPGKTYAAIGGRVRLVGQAAPGASVRIYGERGSVVIDGVTDEWRPYTLASVATDGAKVSASAAGYVSHTRDVTGGSTDVDLALQPSQKYLEIDCDTHTLRICSDDTVQVSAMLRDCEGKGISGRQVKLTTTMGTFAGSGAREAILTTDASGFVQATLSAAPDGAGVASLRAQDYPDEQCSAQVDISFQGPAISVSASQAFLSQAGTSTISARLIDGSLPVQGAPVTFDTDHGVFQETGSASCTVTTDELGYARAVLSLAGPGTARVLAVYTNNCSQQTLGWVVVAYATAPWYGPGVLSSHPLVADIDGAPDGKKEIVVVTSAGNLSVLSADGAVQWFKALHPPGSNTPACAPMDSERSGLPVIFMPAENQQKVYAYAHNGAPIAGWPAGSNYRFIKVAATIGDANLDGSPEIIAGDECCYMFSWNPTGDWKNTGTAESSYLWKNLTGTPSTAIYGSSCALGDIDGDPKGIPDVAVGTNRAPEVYTFPGDVWGDFVSNPLYLDGWPRSSHGRVESSPALGDMDGDGKNDMAVGSDDGNLYVWLSATQSWLGFPTGGQIQSSPALCDLDHDGKLDAIVGSDSGRVFAFNWLGQAPAGWAGGIKLSPSQDAAVVSSPVVGDVNGDGAVEVVVGCNDGIVYALYSDGLNHRGPNGLTGPIVWVRSCVPPGQALAQLLTAPVIDDLDNDGKVEVVVAGERGVYIFHFDAPYAQDPALYPWPTFHRDNTRTGCATPCPAPIRASIQGIVTKHGVPVKGAKVYIHHNDGSTVPIPHSDPTAPRDAVFTVGSLDLSEVCKGAYSINQLEPNQTYRLLVVAAGEPEKVVPDIAVTTGLVRVDIELGP